MTIVTHNLAMQTFLACSFVAVIFIGAAYGHWMAHKEPPTPEEKQRLDDDLNTW